METILNKEGSFDHINRNTDGPDGGINPETEDGKSDM